MGIDLVKLMRNMGAWEPRTVDPGNLAPAPTEIAVHYQHRHLLRMFSETTLFAFLKAMLLDQPRDLLSPRGREAFRRFRELKNRLEPMAPETFPGFREGYLEFIDPLVREGIRNIYRSHFEPEPEAEYAAHLARSKKLAAWICEPLA